MKKSRNFKSIKRQSLKKNGGKGKIEDELEITETVIEISYEALIHNMSDDDLKSIAWIFLEEEKLEENSFGLYNYVYENMEQNYILVNISFNVRTDNMLLLTDIPQKNKQIIKLLNELETFHVGEQLLNYKTNKIIDTHNLYNMSFIAVIDNNGEDLTEKEKGQLVTLYKNAMINNNFNYPPVEEPIYDDTIINNLEILFIPENYKIFTIKVEFYFNEILSDETILEFIDKYFNWVNIDVYTKLSYLFLVPNSVLYDHKYITLTY
jgi:hypothetical protein